MFDTDGSGAIGSEELKKAMRELGVGMSDEHIENIIREVDSDGNGEIDFDEFCACMKKSQRLAKATNDELIRECFEIFDQDRNGVITENEFKYVAKEFGEFSDELADKVFRELDVSSVGHLSIDQFAAIVEDYLFSERSEYGGPGGLSRDASLRSLERPEQQPWTSRSRGGTRSECPSARIESQQREPIDEESE
ncbi:unnamed protein product, partial [Mesorhabditis spiculigera]